MVRKVRAKFFSTSSKRFRDSRFVKNKFAVFERSQGSKIKVLKSFSTQTKANKFAENKANQALILRKKTPGRRRRFFGTLKLTGVVGKA